MQKLLLLSLWMPLAAVGSTVYTFSEDLANRGTVGFTYAAPDYLTKPTTYVNAWSLTGCDTSAMPGWICTGAYLRQIDINGLPDVQVSLNLLYLAAAGDAFSSDEINESFPGATLTSDGVYQAFLSGATLTVHDPPDQADAAAPEPGTWGTLALAGILLGIIRFRRTAEVR